MEKENNIKSEPNVEKENSIEVSNEKEKNSEETKKADGRKKGRTNIVTTKQYTDKELTDLIRTKYCSHNKYYNVLQNIVNQISENEFKEIDKSINELALIVTNKDKLSLESLKRYTIQIPILMYRLNDKLSNRGFDMEISSYLNNLEISERIFEQVGGTEKERLRAAEYNSMVSTFTSLIKTRLYYNLKSKLDYASKVYDGIKKVISAEIEEMKLFGKDINK